MSTKYHCCNVAALRCTCDKAENQQKKTTPFLNPMRRFFNFIIIHTCDENRYVCSRSTVGPESITHQTIEIFPTLEPRNITETKTINKVTERFKSIYSTTERQKDKEKELWNVRNLELLGCGALFFEISGCDREEFQSLEGSSARWRTWTRFHHHPIMAVHFLHLHPLWNILLPRVVHHLC